MNDIFYPNDVESEYSALLTAEETVKRKKTGLEAVVVFLMENAGRIWWWSWEFVGKSTGKGHYLSHRAPARASDLAIHHPDLVEHRRIGRYRVYRLRRENMDRVTEWLNEKNSRIAASKLD